MFKKFLVLCVMFSSLVLWSEEKNTSDSATNIVNIVAVECLAEIPMSDEATSAELIAFEELALTDPIRALELSMYYQGWGKDECFYVFDDKKSKSPITRTYVKDSELSRQIEMRNFDKALKFAEIAFDKAKENSKNIDEKVELNLMKLYIMRGVDFASETYSFFVENIANYDFEKEGKIYGRDLMLNFDGPPLGSLKYPELHIYFYFKGLGTEKDIEFAKELFQLSGNYYPNTHYSRKYYIQDLDFVDFLVENTPVYPEVLYKAYLIYSGTFNPLYKNEELATKYFNLYEKEIIRLINEFSTKLSERFNNKDDKRALFYAQKYIYINPLYEEYLIIRNPFYNIALAKYLYKGKSDYLKYYNITMSLLMNNSISDAKKCLKEALLEDKITEGEKKHLEELFNKIYNVKKRNWLLVFEEYSNLKKIDFDTL